LDGAQLTSASQYITEQL